MNYWKIGRDLTMNKPGIKLLQGIQHCRLEENKTLALFTSYGTGGVTHIWAEPYTIEAVGQILVRVHEENVPLFVLGFGSNVLVADQGWPGVTLTIRENLSPSLLMRSIAVQVPEQRYKALSTIPSRWDSVEWNY